MSTEIDTKAGSLIDNNEIGNENKMFVGGLSKKTTVEAFRTYFEAYGEVKDVVVKTDPSTGTSRGFGFVMFTAEESIGKVLAAGPHNLDGKRIDPKKSGETRREDVCRRREVRHNSRDDQRVLFSIWRGGVRRPPRQQADQRKQAVLLCHLQEGRRQQQMH